MIMTRRTTIAGLAAAPFAAPSVLRAQPALRKYRMLLNTAYSGPQAWLIIAQDNGYLREEGLELELTTGAEAFTAAPRMAAEGFDFGYGDVNSLIEVAARTPAAAPVGVFMMFNASPSTVAVRTDGTIRTAKDLVGRTISGHPTDVALRTFGAFAKAAGFEAGAVKISPFDSSMRAQVEGLFSAGRYDGCFGYVSTISAAAAAAKIDSGSIRFLRYADIARDLYGSTVMASRRILRDDPAAVSALLRGLNRGLATTLRDLDAAIDAVRRKDPSVTPAVEKLRLLTTLQIEMSHAEGRTRGIGSVDPDRLARSIALIAETNSLPMTPKQQDIFVDTFLPPLSERVTTLAAG